MIRAAGGLRRTSVVPLRSKLSFRRADGGFANTGGTGQTIRWLTNLEAIPALVRLVHYNDQTGATWAVSGAAIAATSQTGVNAADTYQPYNASAAQDNTLWQSVTYNNAGADTDYFSQAAGSTLTCTVPAAAVAGQPSIIYSDWMPVGGLARLDGGFGSLLLSSVYSAGNIRYQNTGAISLPSGSRSTSSNWASGNGTISPWTFSANAFGFGEPTIQYIAQAKGATILGVGDSILCGNGSTGAMSSCGFVAAVGLSLAARPVSWMSEGFSGRTSANFYAMGYQAIKHLAPQIVLLQMWSGNDTQTTAAAQSAFESGMALADYAIANGAWPILCTANPRYVGDPTSEVVRVFSNALVRAAGAAGYDVLDLDAIWGTGASPNAYNAAYDSGDHIHPNDAGHRAAANALQPKAFNALLGG